MLLSLLSKQTNATGEEITEQPTDCATKKKDISITKNNCILTWKMDVVGLRKRFLADLMVTINVCKKKQKKQKKQKKHKQTENIYHYFSC